MPRTHRFTESSESPKLTDLVRTFYSDRQLEERMTHMRQTIVKVRQCWETERGNLAASLLQWLEAQAEADIKANREIVEQAQEQQEQQKQVEVDWQLVLQSWRSILAEDRNWADLRPVQPDAEDFPLLREYTDDKSYRLVFSRVLQAMRSGDDTQVLLLVYLIELINIDLYNYSRLRPPCPSRLYRGMALSEQDWLSYRKRLELPVTSRYVAVPLALMSASKSSDVALEFMIREAEVKNQQQQQQLQGGANSSSPAGRFMPSLMVFHILDVSDSLMEPYRRRFPQSVVSTICAVDITEVSVVPAEQEVLLRGAFNQILEIRGPVELQVRGSPEQAGIIEMLVITANRDHLSNGHLGEQDAPARALFAAIVRVTRYAYCREFCRERGLHTDEAAYATAQQEADEELQALLLQP